MADEIQNEGEGGDGRQFASARPVQAAKPLHGEDGKLTREGMERAIREGGAVLLDGRHITRIEDLPSHAELARGDKAKTDAARAMLMRQQADIASQLAMLEGTKDAAQGGAKAQAADTITGPGGTRTVPAGTGGEPGAHPVVDPNEQARRDREAAERMTAEGAPPADDDDNDPDPAKRGPGRPKKHG